MTDHPILFSAPMVKAILREIENPGTGKTQTRRLVKHKPTADLASEELESLECEGWKICNGRDDDLGDTLFKVPFAVGDRLWVRETWNSFTFSQDGDEAWPTDKIPTAEEFEVMKEMAYRFDVQAVHRESDRARQWFSDQKWRPGIHMPRWASRLTLNVTDVRVERLQDISAVDARAEGHPTRPEISNDPEVHDDAARDWFMDLWDSLNAERAPWASNPWVVAYSFIPHLTNIDQMEKAA